MTPHLSELARSEMQFEQFYSAGSVCTPSRISILTGRYPHRFGVKNSIYKDNGDGLAAAGVAVPASAQVDGLNLLPVLEGQPDLPERGHLFWVDTRDKNTQRLEAAPLKIDHVVRSGPWKLAIYAGAPVGLFNMDSDAAEQINLIDHTEQQPRIKELHVALQAHEKEPAMPKPLEDKRTEPLPLKP